VLASLGDAKIPETEQKKIARAIVDQLNGQSDLLSEWALIDWVERTALPELLDIRVTKTLLHLLYRLRLGTPGEDGREKPLVILEAGFASKANLALLRERELGYLINITRGSRAGFAEEFAADGFEKVPSNGPSGGFSKPIPAWPVSTRWPFRPGECSIFASRPFRKPNRQRCFKIRASTGKPRSRPRNVS